MRQRTLTALVMAALFLPILIFGHHYYIFTIFCGLLAVFAAFEIAMVAHKQAGVPNFFAIIMGLLSGGTYLMAYLLYAGVLEGMAVAIYLGLAIFLIMVTNLWFHLIKLNGILYLIVISVYVGFAFAALSTVRDAGLLYIIYVLLTAMLTDTFAYFVGIKYGKHRLAVKISPKKSVEGAIAGLLIGGSLASLLAIILDLFAMHWSLTVLLTFGLSAIGQFGDLVASKIKRDYNVKDFSNLFPGHGGIMDRFDSWTFTALGLVIIAGLANIIFVL
ncbi:MAG: phosphatidate cytidylyltransferase [Candidatus Izemoplasmatales bacterium]